MDNSEKIFEKIKNASLHQDMPDFQSMDKVWSRVESKLDNKVLKKENKLWKKIAVAASLLLVLTVSYQIFVPKEDTVVIKNTETIATEPRKAASPIVILENTDYENHGPSQESVKKVMPIPAPEAVAIAEESVTNAASSTDSEPASVTIPEPQVEVADFAKEEDRNADKQNKQRNFRRAQIFNSRSVRRDEVATQAAAQKKATKSEKSEPLVVVDGKPATASNTNLQAVKDELSKLNGADIEDIIVLKEPLYVINGNYYSEQELFGPNPTSPYYPLYQQEIETLSILQGEKAIAAYGEKGKKGVVIISTKNGKPVKAPPRTE